MPLQLVIGNKAYSSWSLRPWLLMSELGIPFVEKVVPLFRDDTAKSLMRLSPSGRVPALIDGDIVIWESLAIIKYLAERFPDHRVWPRKRAARAQARALCAEMHAGFAALRRHLPTNFRRDVAAREIQADVAADITRIEAAFAAATRQFGGNNPFLFGKFSAADAMFAPVVNRFHVYDVPVTPATRAYMDIMLELPSYQRWVEGAAAEPWVYAPYEL